MSERKHFQNAVSKYKKLKTGEIKQGVTMKVGGDSPSILVMGIPENIERSGRPITDLDPGVPEPVIRVALEKAHFGNLVPLRQLKPT